MLLEIYLVKFILFCVAAFLFGYYVVYKTITKAPHKGGFDTFYFFNKIGLPSLFEAIWKLVVNSLKFLTGGKLEVEKFDTKK